MMSDNEPYRLVYDYTSVPTIRKFALSKARIKGLMGPFGSGKSSGCMMEIVRKSHEQAPGQDGLRRSRWAIVRNTYPQLRDTTIKTVHDWFPPAVFGEWQEAKHNYQMSEFPGCHIELLFRALDRPDHVKNLLSLELTGCWINEAREVPKAIFDAIDGRVGRYPAVKDGGCTWDGILMDTNPPDEDSWWYKYFEVTRPYGSRLFKQPSGLSPRAENIPNLKPHYYQVLMRGKDAQYIKVYVHGEYGFVIEGQPVYQQYSDVVHCALYPLEPIRGLPIIVGLDFGLTPAAVICQFTQKGQLRILDELISESLGLRNFAKNMLIPLLSSKYRGFEIRGSGDPAGSTRVQTDESTCFEILEAVDLSQIEPAHTNSLIARIGSVEDLLTTMVDGEPCLVVSPNCTFLRKGFNGGYRKKALPGVSDMYSEVPEKNMFSHVHDALQYAAMSVAKKQEEDMRMERLLAMLQNTQARRTATNAGY